MHFGLLSPATGVIVKSYVSDGQYVKEGERLFEIASFKRMWFLFSASEQDLPLLQVGALVDVTTPSLPGQVIKARVSFINPVLDAASRSAQVRVVLENPDGRLRDKTYAQGAVEIELPEVLAVPRSAVLWPGGRPRVYVEQAPGVYARRGVRLGRAGDTHWEVLAGLQAGERVVTAGNMLVDSQAQWDEMSDTDIASSKPGPAAELCAAQPKP
jgi:Cu(I)/Ag(I) efflux system membrane fusion protein